MDVKAWNQLGKKTKNKNRWICLLSLLSLTIYSGVCKTHWTGCNWCEQKGSVMENMPRSTGCRPKSDRKCQNEKSYNFFSSVCFYFPPSVVWKINVDFFLQFLFLLMYWKDNSLLYLFFYISAMTEWHFVWKQVRIFICLILLWFFL